jgi:hypothetical protein
LSAVDIQLESAWFQPFNLSSVFLVSKFAFKFNLYRYSSAKLDDYVPSESSSVSRGGDAFVKAFKPVVGLYTTHQIGP